MFISKAAPRAVFASHQFFSASISKSFQLILNKMERDWKNEHEKFLLEEKLKALNEEFNRLSITYAALKSQHDKLDNQINRLDNITVTDYSQIIN